MFSTIFNKCCLESGRVEVTVSEGTSDNGWVYELLSSTPLLLFSSPSLTQRTGSVKPCFSFFFSRYPSSSSLCPDVTSTLEFGVPKSLNNLFLSLRVGTLHSPLVFSYNKGVSTSFGTDCKHKVNVTWILPWKSVTNSRRQYFYYVLRLFIINHLDCECFQNETVCDRIR